MTTILRLAICLAFAITLAGCGLQNPIGRDDTSSGESTPQEDAAAIAVYTQTVNQVQTTSTDLDVAAGGDVFIVTGDGTFTYRPIRYAPPPEDSPAVDQPVQAD